MLTLSREEGWNDRLFVTFKKVMQSPTLTSNASVLSLDNVLPQQCNQLLSLNPRSTGREIVKSNDG